MSCSAPSATTARPPNATAKPGAAHVGRVAALEHQLPVGKTDARKLDVAAGNAVDCGATSRTGTASRAGACGERHRRGRSRSRRQRANRSSGVRGSAVDRAAKWARAERVGPSDGVRALPAGRGDANERSCGICRVTGGPPPAESAGHLHCGRVAIGPGDPQHGRSRESLCLSKDRLGDTRGAAEHHEVVDRGRLQGRSRRAGQSPVRRRQQHRHLPEARPPPRRERVGSGATVGEHDSASEKTA